MSPIWIKLHRAPGRPIVVNLSAAFTIEATENGLTRIVFPETGEDADGVVLVTETVDQIHEKITKDSGAWRWEYSFNPQTLGLFGFPMMPGKALVTPPSEAPAYKRDT